ncbi:iron ABC transporter substrate-binding protein [Ornithinimicrobium sp. LYQ92]|uniref:iron ABC transporter substrate-binding protein n=1 Tax=Serinicoccus sp. LYQ92 TaxID=3378798 RepID=UPI003854F389
MSRTLRLALTSTVLAATLAACGGTEGGSDDTTTDDTTSTDDDGASADATGGDGTVTLYSGRNEDLVQPVIDQFTEATGIEVEVRYAGTAEMAAQLLEEGENSPAEAFLAQDAGALGAVAAGGLLQELPQETLDAVPETFRSADGTWVGLTGRSRVLVYNKDLVSEDELPASVDELTEPQWEGRVGLAPTNASFQAFITAMRVLEGDDAATSWMADMAANDPQLREGNGPIVADVEAGTMDAGLVNHYYLYEVAQEQGVEVEDLGSALHFFSEGDTGALVNISGIGMVGEQADGEAQLLIDHLLSTEGQTYFVEETSEYPMIEGLGAPEGLPALEELQTPEIDLNDLEDLQTTVQMITESGLL